MPMIGLTGGLATGKSMVSSMFVDLGAYLLDCDILAREVVEPGTKGQDMVIREFGGLALKPDGTLDRATLGEIVFDDPAKRKKLESILHPLIRKIIKTRSGKIVDRDPGAVVLVDAIALFESGLNRMMEESVVVVCEEKIRKQRAIARGDLSVAQIDKRINAQWPLSKKAELADYIIDNSGSPEQTLEQVKTVWAKIRPGRR